MASGVKTFVVKVPNENLYSIVRNLDSSIQPLLGDQYGTLVGYAPEYLLEDIPPFRMVTKGTNGGLITTHNYQPRANGDTEVMLEMEVGLRSGGKTAVNLNMVIWIMAYKAIETGYLAGIKDSMSEESLLLE